MAARRFRDSRNRRRAGQRKQERDHDDGKIFTNWDETHSSLWGHQPIQLAHELHKSPLFSMDDARRTDRALSARALQPGADRRPGSSRVWREGDIGNLNGRQVIEAISRGGLWLNMRDVGAVDSRYRKLIDRMFEESRPRFRASRCRNHQEEHSDLVAGCAGLLSCRPAGTGPDPARRPQARLCLSEHARRSSRRSISRTSRSSMSRSICPTALVRRRMPRCSTSDPARC